MAWIAACTIVYLAAAVAVATKVEGLLNHDAVSYLMLARHWLAGRVDLGITGTWSPLLPWCLAAAYAVSGNEDLAVRAVMGLSGLTFLAGACIFYACQANAAVAWIAGLITALFAAALTGVLTTPDLLGSGLFLMGFAAFLDTLKRPRWTMGATSGALLGTAYLAKAIFLPLAVASCLMVLLLDGRRRRQARPGPRFPVATALAAAGVAWSIVALPWITALSVKYERPTYTRATMPQWATIGPKDKVRNQPLNIRFYVPEPGRQSQFEDESILPIESWSPLESRSYFIHYLWHIRKNLVEVQPKIMRRVDLLGVGVLAMVLLFATRVIAFRRRDRSITVPGPWPWLAVPTVLLLGAYALNFGDQLRYYLVAVPGIYLGALVAWPRLGEALDGRRGLIAGYVIAAGSLLLPITSLRADLLDWTEEGKFSAQANILAPQLLAAGVQGPTARVGSFDLKYPAVFLSYRLGTTYNGTEVAVTREAAERSCARLLVLDRNSALIGTLLADGPYVPIEQLVPSTVSTLHDADYTLLWRTAPVDSARCQYSVEPGRETSTSASVRP